MFGLCFEGQWRWTQHFLLVFWLWVVVAALPTVLGFFLGDSKAVLSGCADHWTLQNRAAMPLLFQMTVCVHVRVVVPGAWAAFSYSSVHAPRPDLGLEGDEGALYGWLLGVRHRFPLRLSPTHWHKVCLRRDVQGNSFSLEVDGEVVAQRTVIARAITPSGSLWLGCRPRDRPPGAMLGEVELYLFRVWADLGSHAPCEDGSVIGWDSRFWGVTSAKARQRDPNLLCAHRRVRRWGLAQSIRTWLSDWATWFGKGRSRTPPPGLSSSAHTSSPVIATPPTYNQSEVPAAYYWVFMNVKTGENTTTKVNDWISDVLSCGNNTDMMDLCQGAGQLQKVDVCCDAKQGIGVANCIVLLQLSHAVSVCTIQRALQRAGHGSLHASLTGQVERVGRELCEDVEPSRGGFLRCTSSPSQGDICQSATHCDLKCSSREPGSFPVPQPVREPCGWEGPRLCDCTAFCSDAGQFFALSIKITSPTVDVNVIENMLSKLSRAPNCDTMSNSLCRNHSEVSNRYQGAQLECHETRQRLYSCMVILKMSGPVDVCSLANFLQLHMDNTSGITNDKPLTRMVVCGRPSLPSAELLKSNLTWVASPLLGSEICQPNPALLRCDDYEALAVLLNDTCPDPPEALPTNPGTPQPYTLPNSNITTASETTPPLPANTTQHNNTTAQDNAATQLKNASQGTARPSTTTQLTTLNSTQNSPVVTTATPLHFSTTAIPQNTTHYNNITFHTTPPNTSPGTGSTAHTTQTSVPNNPHTTVSPGRTTQPNATLHSTALPADNGAVYNTTATSNTTLQITPGSDHTTVNTTVSSYTPTTLGPTVTVSDNTTVHNATTDTLIITTRLSPNDTTMYNITTNAYKQTVLNITTLPGNTTLHTTASSPNLIVSDSVTTTVPNNTVIFTGATQGNETPFTSTTSQDDSREHSATVSSYNPTTLGPTVTVSDNTMVHNTTASLSVAKKLLWNTTDTLITTTRITTRLSPNDTMYNITTNAYKQTVLNITTLPGNTTLHTTTSSPNLIVSDSVTTTVPNNNTVIFTGATQGNETPFTSTTPRDESREHSATVSSYTPTTLGPMVTVSDNTTVPNTTASQITTLSTPTHNAKPHNATTYNTTQFPAVAPINATLLSTTDTLINTTQIITTLSPNDTTAYNVTAATNNGTLQSSAITPTNATVNTTATSPNYTTADNITTNANNQTVLNITTLPGNTTLHTTASSPNKITTATTRETRQNTTNNNTVIFTAATQGNETLFTSTTSPDNSTMDDQSSTVDNTTVNITTKAPLNTPVNNQTTNYTAMSNVARATIRNDTNSTITTTMTTATSLNTTFSPTATRETHLNLNSTHFNHVFNQTIKGPGFNSTTAVAAVSTSLETVATTSTMMTTASQTTTTHGPPPVQANQSSTTNAEVSLTSATTAPIQTFTTTTSITTTTTIITTTVAKETTTSNQDELEEESEELLYQTLDASQLNSSQVAQVVGNLEKLLEGPTVSKSVGQRAINIISSLMEGDSSALSASANRLIRTVDGLGLKLVVADESEVLTADSLILAVRTVDGTNFPATSVNILNNAGLQLNILSRFQSRSSETIVGSVFLPSSLTEGLSPEEKRRASRVQFSFYTTTSLFQDIALGNQTLVSPVLGVSVANLTIGNLSENIEFTIRNTDPLHVNYEASCAFWDFTLNGGGGGWNTTGCFVINTTQENTTCSCNHLTSFAILLDVSRGGLPDSQHAIILTYITYIGCGISAIFVAVTLLTYISFPKLLRDIPSKILVQLCLSLFFLNLLFLLDGWLALFQATGLCISTAFFLHYFLLTSFTWAGLEALHMYLSIVQVFTPYLSRYMLKFSLLGWGLPFIVVIIVISVDKDNYGLVTYGKSTNGTSDDFCWLRNDIAFYIGVVAYFILIFALSLLVFIVVLVQLARIKRQNPQNQSPQRGLMTDLRSITGLIILLGLTWGFALFAWGPLYLPFVYLFSIFNSLQGFFIFVFHCAVKENVRRQWRTYLCCGSLRLAENSEWSRTATQNPNKLSVTTATSSALNPLSRSSSVISDGTNSSGSVFADSGISDGSHGDVVLNEFHRRNTVTLDLA